jgi:hypothetical protein
MSTVATLGTKVSAFSQSSSSYWTQQYYILKSGDIWYRREINNALGYFALDYSDDAGATYENLVTLNLTEDSVLIDLAHIYRHQIRDFIYYVDRTITAIGYAGVENVDWEYIYSSGDYWDHLKSSMIFWGTVGINPIDKSSNGNNATTSKMIADNDSMVVSPLLQSYLNNLGTNDVFYDNPVYEDDTDYMPLNEPKPVRPKDVRIIGNRIFGGLTDLMIFNAALTGSNFKHATKGLF